MMKNNSGIVILGPTGSGKTSIGIEVAQQLCGEIISCDSMQVYRGMAIGTAQPTVKERALVPYHLVDFLEISEPYSASVFVDHCKEIIPKLNSSNKVPIVVGGTGMYASFLCNGHDQFPTDKAVANEILARYESGEYEILCQELNKYDSESFEKCRHNPRRVLRALEICTLINGSIISSEKKFEEPLAGNFEQFVLLYSPEKMRERIALRTRQMVEEGWIEEAQALFERGLMQTPTARQALGYSIIFDYFNPIARIASEKHMLIPTKEALIERLICKTAQYAKKQRTWFKNQHPNAIFIDMDNVNYNDVIKTICQSYKNKVCK